MDTERIAAEAEDLAAHGVDGRLRQALELADMFAELVDDFLDMLEDAHPMPCQLAGSTRKTCVHTSFLSPRGSRRHFGA